MKLILMLVLFFLVSGCVSTGYNPHYIVSDTLDEEAIPPQQEPSDPISF